MKILPNTNTTQNLEDVTQEFFKDFFYLTQTQHILPVKKKMQSDLAKPKHPTIHQIHCPIFWSLYFLSFIFFFRDIFFQERLLLPLGFGEGISVAGRGWTTTFREVFHHNPRSFTVRLKCYQAWNRKGKLFPGFKYFWFSPLLREMIQTNMFQQGWNHQLDSNIGFLRGRFVKLPRMVLKSCPRFIPLRCRVGMVFFWFFLWLEVGISFKNKQCFEATLVDWKVFLVFFEDCDEIFFSVKLKKLKHRSKF